MRTTRIGLLSAIILTLQTSATWATGEIYCKASDGRSGEIAMNISRLVVLNVLSAEVTAFGKTWATSESAENAIIVGQAFQNESQMRVDFMDINAENIIISLQTLRVATNDAYVESGILRIGKAVYPVICES